QLYRAALEGLSLQLRLALESLERAYGFRAKGVRVVGGGSKNELWNQIRADVLGKPVTVPRQSEATVLGAAIAAFKGAGVYSSMEEGLRRAAFGLRSYEPSRRAEYDALYRRFTALLEALSRAGV
ncbi:MAG: FGGY-family carbohydrate kinase, partial [Thermofilaceae archaeon]